MNWKLIKKFGWLTVRKTTMQEEEFAIFWGVNIFGNISEIIFSKFKNSAFLNFEKLNILKCKEAHISISKENKKKVENHNSNCGYVCFKNNNIHEEEFNVLKEMFINSLKKNIKPSVVLREKILDSVCLVFKIKFISENHSGDFEVIIPLIIIAEKEDNFYFKDLDYKETEKVREVLKFVYLNKKRAFSKKWNILDCFKKLDKKELQKFIYYLITKGLTLRDISYILLGLNGEIRNKIIKSLSDKAQDEIYFLMPDIKPDELNKRKNEPYLIRFKKACAKADEIFYEAIKQNKINFSSLKELEKLKKYFEIQKAQNFLAKKENNLKYILKNEKDENRLRNIFSKIPFDTIVYSCVGEDVEVLSTIKNCISLNNAKQLECETAKIDSSFFYKRILDEKVKLIKILKNSLEENEIDRLKKILRFMYVNSKNGSALIRLIEYTPVEFFARALGNDFKKEFWDVYINLPGRKQFIFENTLKYEKYCKRKDTKLESAKYIIKKIKELYKKNKISFYTDNIMKRDYFRTLMDI